VRETLDFAARVQGGGRRPQELRQLQELEAAAGLLPDPEIDAFMKASDHRVCRAGWSCTPCTQGITLPGLPLLLYQIVAERYAGGGCGGRAL
jgi:hypothetical protein